MPARSAFTNKAMTAVHGADLTVVEGTLDDAGAAYTDAMTTADWHSVATFVTPYRHEGKKTMLYEIVEQLDWSVPDRIVFPTGGGVGLVGLAKAARELESLGLVDRMPALYAAQARGCAPIVAAQEAARDQHHPWTDPDTICGGIEVPDPGASPLILRAIRETGGGAVATTDTAILDTAVDLAQTGGVEMSVTAAVAASGARELAAEGAFDRDDTVVIVNTACGSRDADVTRSHLHDARRKE